MIISKLITTVLTVGFLFNQANHEFYIESWKKGKRTIQEQKLTIALDAKQPKYRALIKDAAGKERYELTVIPGFVSKNEPGFEWSVEFKTKTSIVDHLLDDDRVNLLKPSNDPYQDYFTTEDYLWFFAATGEGHIFFKNTPPDEPELVLLSKRVFKVESFYVILYVKSYKRNAKYQEALDSMELCIEFANKYTRGSP